MWACRHSLCILQVWTCLGYNLAAAGGFFGEPKHHLPRLLRFEDEEARLRGAV